MIHVIQQYVSIGDFLHVSHLEMERNKEHVLGKVVLVQAYEGEKIFFTCTGTKGYISELCTIRP